MRGGRKENNEKEKPNYINANRRKNDKREDNREKIR